MGLPCQLEGEKRGTALAPRLEDRPWFEPLARSLERPAFQFALMLVRDRPLAEDIVQEAFARVWASPRTPSAEPEFRRWLYRAITNLARDHYRRSERFARLRFWAPPAPDPLEEIERRLGDDGLALALQRLSLRERRAIHLHYVEDKTFAEADRLLGTRDGNTRVTVHRALQKLRRRLVPVVTEEAPI
jgi:RNA polymerase sigma factor (sigma-70 family)